jgi:predicted ATP-grasp superfamily ATP-dependent carboligase
MTHALGGRPRVLVTDGQERWTVAVCRSLSKAGFSVTVAADFRPAVAHWSRFCDTRVRVPPPQTDPGAFVEILERVLRSRRHALLIPSGDASLRVISDFRDRLEPLLEGRLGLPSVEAVIGATDKLRLRDAAVIAGLPCPETVPCSGFSEALEAATALGFPVVLKPQRSVFPLDGVMVREPSRLVTDAEQLARVIGLFGSSCLVQRAEAGTVHSLAGVCADDRMLALSLARYLRTWPPEAGNASMAETVPAPPGLADRVRSLLGSLGWQGIFELELLRRGDGSFAALDLNPRPFGSIALAIRAGADLPELWAEWLLGGEPKQVLARPNVRYRWELAELRRLAWEARHGNIGAAIAILRPTRATVYPHFSWDDPGPLAALALYLVHHVLARRMREEGVRA